MTLDKKGLENSGYIMRVNLVEAVAHQGPCELIGTVTGHGLNDTFDPGGCSLAGPATFN